MPTGIQLRRTKGWQLPQGAVIVSRPTPFGNPFRQDSLGQELAVGLYRAWLDGSMTEAEIEAILGSVGQRLPDRLVQRRLEILAALDDLRGQDLACWCRLEQPCHRDVLLALANRDLSMYEPCRAWLPVERIAH